MRILHCTLTMIVAMFLFSNNTFSQTEDFVETTNDTKFTTNGFLFNTTVDFFIEEFANFGCDDDFWLGTGTGNGGSSGTFGSFTGAASGSKFILSTTTPICVWTSANDASSYASGDIEFIGTLAAGGTVSETFSIVPPDDYTFDNITFSNAIWGGQELTSVEVKPAGSMNLNYISIDNLAFASLISATSNAPEINVQSSTSININDGAGLAAANVINETDFGDINVVSGTKSYTYTVINSGTADLDFTGSPFVDITGTNAGDFLVTTQISTDPLPHTTGNTTTFTVEFNPSDFGERSATISIANDDSDENPYDFVVKGTGTDFLEIFEDETNGAVSFNTDGFMFNTTGDLAVEFFNGLGCDSDYYLSSVIGNGGSSGSFGTFAVASSGNKFIMSTTSSTCVWTSANDGAAYASGDIEFIGTLATGGTVSETFSIVPPDDYTFDNITFSNAIWGGQELTSMEVKPAGTMNLDYISIDNIPFENLIVAPPTTPEIDVQGNSTSIADGDTSPSTADDTDFGSVANGGSEKHIFRIKNTDVGGLTIPLNGITINSDVAGVFTLGTTNALPQTLAQNENMPFEVIFTPNAGGATVFDGDVSIANNDADEDPYNFDIKGTGVTPMIESVSNGAWTTPGTWNLNRVPTSADIVTIKNGHNVSTNSLSDFMTLEIENGGTLTCNNGTDFQSTGGITNNGTFFINSTITIESDVTNTNTGTFEWNSGYITSAAGATVFNSGTLNIDVINLNPTNGDIQLNFVNESGGTTQKTGNGTQFIPSNFENKAGATLILALHQGLRFDGDFINAGTINVDGALSFNGVNATFNGGMIDGTGSISINNSACTFTGSDFTPGVATVNHSGQVDGTGLTMTIPAGTTYNLFNGSSLENCTSVTNAGQLDIDGSTTLENDITNTSTGTFEWNGGYITSAAGSTLTNFGTLNIDAINVNPGSGNIQLNFVNESGGTAQKNGGNGTQFIPSSFENKAGATLTLHAGQTLRFDGDFINAGTINIDGALSFNGVNATFNGGMIDGTGTINIDNSACTFTGSDFTPGVATVNHSGQVDGTGLTMTIPAGTTYNLFNASSLENCTSVTNAGQLDIDGSTTLENDITNTSTGTFEWNGGYITSAAGSTLTNFGTLNIDAINVNPSLGNVQLNFVNESGGTTQKNGGNGTQFIPSSFENKAGATLTLHAGKTLRFDGNFINAGTINVDGGLSFNGVNATFNGGMIDGTGTITIDNSACTFTGSNFTPGVATVNHNGQVDGTGLTMTIPTGTTYTLNNFSSLENCTSVTNAGHLNINGSITLENDITNNGVFEWNNGYITSAASSSVINHNTLYIDALNINPASGNIDLNFVNESGATVTSNNTGFQNIPSTITNKSGGTFNMPTGKTIGIMGDLINDGDMIGDGTYQFSPPIAPNTNTWSGTGTMKNVNFNNVSSNTTLTGTQTITGTLNMVSGKLLLGNNDLHVTGDLINANANKYIVTTGTGRLRLEVDGATTFPVGPDATSYNPVILEQLSGAADFGVSVASALTNPFIPEIVNREWTIDNLSGTPNADVTLQWLTAHESATFDRSGCAVSRWDGSAWEQFAGSASSFSNPFHTQTATGVTTFSPFTVANSLPELDIRNNADDMDIIDGSTTISTALGTDFGGVGIAGGSSSMTFRAENNGASILTFGADALSISNTTDFSITTDLTDGGTVAAAAVETFTIEFDPSSIGTKTCTVTVNSDDGNEDPYTFEIEGEGLEAATALDFDGVDDHVLISSPPAYNNNAFTFESWIKRAGSSSNPETFVSYGTSAVLPSPHSANFRIFNDKLEFGLYNGAWQGVTSAQNVSNGVWTHVAVTKNGNSVELFINGTSVQTGTITSSISVDVLAIGHLINNGVLNPGFPYAFPGEIDEVRIWDRVLCEAEIAGGMSCELAGTETGLVAYYNFNQGFVGANNAATTTLDDQTANNNDGTLTNFALSGSTSNWIDGTANGVSGSCTTVACPEPEITVDDATVGTNFGGVGVGTTATLTYTITNDGTADLDLGAITSDNALYTIANYTNPTTVTPGMTTTFDVEFAPTAAGVQNATIAIASNDADENPYNIAVMGEGLDAATALNFDGADDVISVANEANFDLSTVSIEAYIYLESYSFYPKIVTKRSSVSSAFDFGIDNTDKLHLQSQIGNLTGGTIPLNQWVHVAGVFEDLGNGTTAMTSYINGAFDQTTIVSGTLPMNDGTVAIGGLTYVNGDYFTGSIDEVRIWDYALCAAEVSGRKDCELAGNETGLLAYYTFNQGNVNGNNASVTTLTDATANGNDGTLTNFALSGSASNWIDGTANGVSGSCTTVACPEPEITVDDATVGTNFGGVGVGTTATLTYTITNDGTADLDLGAITSNNALFTIANYTNPTTVTPGMTATFDVEFAPTAAGVQNATIAIASNDADENPYNIAVMGEGLDAATALDFDGADDHVLVSSPPAYNNNAFTYESWIKTTGPNVETFLGYGTASSSSPDHSANFRVYNGKLEFGTWDGAWQAVTSTQNVNTGVWTHVAVTKNGNNIELFINGVSVQTGTITSSLTVDVLSIGHVIINGVLSHGFPGEIDEVRIWDRALCEAEIAAGMNCELAGTEPNLQAYYQFNQGYVGGNNSSETTLTDATGNGYNGTLTNFALSGSASNWIDGTANGVSGSCTAVSCAPELDLRNNADDADITDGSTTISTSLGTDFGSVCAAGTASSSSSFRAENNGQGDLTFDADALSISNPTDFSITTDLTNNGTVAAGGVATFTIEFDPQSAGTKTCTVTINSDDADEDPYTFDIQGVGTDPTITLAATTSTATENGSTDLVYQFTRTCTVGTLVVYFSVDGTAQDSDYSLSGQTSYASGTGTITFADGSATADLTVAMVDDSMIEGDETVVVTIVIPE